MNIFDNRRVTVRAPVNPMDKSTVISILPKPIDEVKHTIQPGYFHLDPGSYEKPSILIVGSSSWWREIDNEQPLLEIPMSSVQIAKSIVDDYSNGVLACDMGDSMPGLFYLPGNISVPQLKKEYKELLDRALVRQRNWYAILVKIADTLWARTNGNPITISEDMRLAARELNLESNKEWTRDTLAMELIRCIACGSFRNPSFPICQTCKAIVDPIKAKELGLTFVA